MGKRKNKQGYKMLVGIESSYHRDMKIFKSNSELRQYKRSQLKQKECLQERTPIPPCFTITSLEFSFVANQTMPYLSKLEKPEQEKKLKRIVYRHPSWQALFILVCFFGIGILPSAMAAESPNSMRRRSIEGETQKTSEELEPFSTDTVLPKIAEQLPVTLSSDSSATDDFLSASQKAMVIATRNLINSSTVPMEIWDFIKENSLALNDDQALLVASIFDRRIDNLKVDLEYHMLQFRELAFSKHDYPSDLQITTLLLERIKRKQSYYSNYIEFDDFIHTLAYYCYAKKPDGSSFPSLYNIEERLEIEKLIVFHEQINAINNSHSKSVSIKRTKENILTFLEEMWPAQMFKYQRYFRLMWDYEAHFLLPQIDVQQKPIEMISTLQQQQLPKLAQYIYGIIKKSNINTSYIELLFNAYFLLSDLNIPELGYIRIKSQEDFLALLSKDFFAKPLVITKEPFVDEFTTSFEIFTAITIVILAFEITVCGCLHRRKKAIIQTAKGRLQFYEKQIKQQISQIELVLADQVSLPSMPSTFEAMEYRMLWERVKSIKETKHDPQYRYLFGLLNELERKKKECAKYLIYLIDADKLTISIKPDKHVDEALVFLKTCTETYIYKPEELVRLIVQFEETKKEFLEYKLQLIKEKALLDDKKRVEQEFEKNCEEYRQLKFTDDLSDKIQRPRELSLCLPELQQLYMKVEEECGQIREQIAVHYKNIPTIPAIKDLEEKKEFNNKYLTWLSKWTSLNERLEDKMGGYKAYLAKVKQSYIEQRKEIIKFYNGIKKQRIQGINYQKECEELISSALIRYSLVTQELQQEYVISVREEYSIRQEIESIQKKVLILTSSKEEDDNYLLELNKLRISYNELKQRLTKLEIKLAKISENMEVQLEKKEYAACISDYTVAYEQAVAQVTLLLNQLEVLQKSSSKTAKLVATEQELAYGGKRAKCERLKAFQSPSQLRGEVDYIRGQISAIQEYLAELTVDLTVVQNPKIEKPKSDESSTDSVPVAAAASPLLPLESKTPKRQPMSFANSGQGSFFTAMQNLPSKPVVQFPFFNKLRSLLADINSLEISKDWIEFNISIDKAISLPIVREHKEFILTHIKNAKIMRFFGLLLSSIDVYQNTYHCTLEYIGYIANTRHFLMHCNGLTQEELSVYLGCLINVSKNIIAIFDDCRNDPPKFYQKLYMELSEKEKILPGNIQDKKREFIRNQKFLMFMVSSVAPKYLEEDKESRVDVLLVYLDKLLSELEGLIATSKDTAIESRLPILDLATRKTIEIVILDNQTAIGEIIQQLRHTGYLIKKPCDCDYEMFYEFSNICYKLRTKIAHCFGDAYKDDYYDLVGVETDSKEVLNFYKDPEKIAVIIEQFKKFATIVREDLQPVAPSQKFN